MSDNIRIAATADLHCSRNSQGAFQALFAKIPEQADVLLLCGDLTDHGLPEEAQILVKEFSGIRLPMIAVLGNHDFHSDKQDEVARILQDAGIQVLDGEVAIVRDVGFAGIKGFAGGFNRFALEPWGEVSIKAFVREAVDETLKLESALARLRTPRRIALLHYAPIRDTVDGEPPEIHSFLGSSRLEEPLNRYEVSMAFHGHAHHGKPEGRTLSGIPVYNVSMKILQATNLDHAAVRIVEIPVA